MRIKIFAERSPNISVSFTYCLTVYFAVPRFNLILKSRSILGTMRHKRGESSPTANACIIGGVMIPKYVIAAITGLLVFVLGLFFVIYYRSAYGTLPTLIGLSLIYIGYKPGRAAVIVFGHLCIVVGCFLTTLGIYMLPYCKPTFAHVCTRPLFWRLFSIFGGICAVYHGFCHCFLKNVTMPEDGQ